VAVRAQQIFVYYNEAILGSFCLTQTHT